MGLGLGVGCADAMRFVEEDIKKAIPTKFDGLNIDVSAATRTSPASNERNSVAQAGNVENKYEIVINNPNPQAA